MERQKQSLNSTLKAKYIAQYRDFYIFYQQ